MQLFLFLLLIISIIIIIYLLIHYEPTIDIVVSKNCYLVLLWYNKYSDNYVKGKKSKYSYCEYRTHIILFKYE